MTVSEAINVIETLGGYTFVRRMRHFNLDTNRRETAYCFSHPQGNGLTTFDCLSQLRYYAKKFQYTHGIR